MHLVIIKETLNKHCYLKKVYFLCFGDLEMEGKFWPENLGDKKNVNIVKKRIKTLSSFQIPRSVN